jgi:hypothetical protein
MGLIVSHAGHLVSKMPEKSWNASRKVHRAAELFEKPVDFVRSD